MTYTAEQVEALLPYLTPEEQKELDRLLAAPEPLWSPLPGPQTMAYNSEADIIGFGGAAGGGKSDLVIGMITTKQKRALVIRREKAQTEGIVQRMGEIVEDTTGYNSQKGIWKVSKGTQPLVEFGGLDNLGDERRWQGRPHDCKAFDEVTEQREAQVRFIMGWMRTDDPKVKTKVIMTFNPPTTSEGRWVIAFFAPWLDPSYPNPAMPGELRYATTINGEDEWVDSPKPFVLQGGEKLYDFNPKDYSPEDIIVPKSRTFIPSRITDNPYLVNTGYMAQLQAMPEPLRSQMLYGDFTAGVQDDPWQVIPTSWVETAMSRWKKPDVIPPMDSLGVDVARGGKDKTIIAARHSMWFDEPRVFAGSETPNGPAVAGQVVGVMRNRARIHIDVIGVGASPYDFLHQAELDVIGVNVSEKATAMSKEGKLKFFNLRTQLYWKMREALDPANNTGIALPPSKELKADLCAVKWSMSGMSIKVESREDIVKRLGRSPDYASAYVLALMDSPLTPAQLLHPHAKNAGKARREYNPYK